LEGKPRGIPWQTNDVLVWGRASPDIEYVRGTVKADFQDPERGLGALHRENGQETSDQGDGPGQNAFGWKLSVRPTDSGRAVEMEVEW